MALRAIINDLDPFANGLGEPIDAVPPVEASDLVYIIWPSAPDYLQTV